MVQAPTPTLILEEFLKLLETKLDNEYINGQIIQKPISRKHSKLISIAHFGLIYLVDILGGFSLSTDAIATAKTTSFLQGLSSMTLIHSTL